VRKSGFVARGRAYQSAIAPALFPLPLSSPFDLFNFPSGERPFLTHIAAYIYTTPSTAPCISEPSTAKPIPQSILANGAKPQGSKEIPAGAPAIVVSDSQSSLILPLALCDDETPSGLDSSVESTLILPDHRTHWDQRPYPRQPSLRTWLCRLVLFWTSTVPQALERPVYSTIPMAIALPLQWSQHCQFLTPRTTIMTQTSCSCDFTDKVSSSLSFLLTGLSTIIGDVDITRRYC
jgi:hypothetical protein